MAAFVIVLAPLGTLLLRLCRPTDLDPFHPDFDQHWNLVAWERDRLQALAKGVAQTGVGFLASLFAALLKGEISDTVPTIWIVGVGLGVIGSLIAALDLYRRASDWARPYFMTTP
jgi:hypothetical protein